jgi:hypothetical protein
MRHRLYPLFLGLLMALCTRAQDTLPTGLSADSSIHLTVVRGARYPSFVYSANGEVVNHRDIMNRLKLYDEPAGELQKYRTAKAVTFVWIGAAVGSVITAAVEGSQRNRGAAYTFGGIAFVALIGEFTSRINEARHFRRAIAIYNKRFLP